MKDLPIKYEITKTARWGEPKKFKNEHERNRAWFRIVAEGTERCALALWRLKNG